MQAAVLKPDRSDGEPFLAQMKVPRPFAKPGYVVLRVLACGVCRTDLHIVEGDLAKPKVPLIPGHQIVGQVIEGGTAKIPDGTRVGVSWMGGVDGSCWYCLNGKENLCYHPTFTGYTVDGGFAEFVLVRADFVFPLPSGLDDTQTAPLLCAGIIGFRSLRVAGVQNGERVGLFGFGSSAALLLPILKSWNCEIYVVTRGDAHRREAMAGGANWTGDEDDRPPAELDRAITFAPAGKVVLDALRSLRKGGVVAINAIHLDGIPAFDYDTLLWGERQLRSVANMTRQDAMEFLALAASLHISPKVNLFPLAQANEALLAVKQETALGSVVLIP